jgi:hypothetical protein
MADERLDTLADWEPRSIRVLYTAEREAYHVLRKALPEHMVPAQVPLARFLKVAHAQLLQRVVAPRAQPQCRFVGLRPSVPGGGYGRGEATHVP